MGHRAAGPAHAVRPAGSSVCRGDLLDPELLAEERLVRMVPGSVNQEWQDYHFPRHTPKGKPIGDGPVVRTIREGIAAVNTRVGLLMLTKRAASYYATPEIAFVEIDLPAMPSALVRRVDDHRPILQDLEALLLRIAERHGVAADPGGLRPDQAAEAQTDQRCESSTSLFFTTSCALE